MPANALLAAICIRSLTSTSSAYATTCTDIWKLVPIVLVAVKVLTLSEVKDEYVIRNMRREGRILAKVSHPNIIYLFETITTTKRYYIITELVDGEDLCSHITAQRTGKLDEKSTRVLARQIISAVAHLHDLGIVHRDLKMENILLDSTKENVKLVDFGLSNCRKGGKLLQTHCGSPEYAAPELYIKGGSMAEKWISGACMYPFTQAHGVIFYGMVVGKLPFQSWHKSGLSIESKRKQLIRETRAGLNQRHLMNLMEVSLLFRNLIEKMLCPNPEERITMINLQAHAWIYGRFYKEYPPLDYNWKKLALYRIAKMVKLPMAEVWLTIEMKRYSPLAGIFNIAKLHELQRRIEVDNFKNDSKETQKKRSVHIDLNKRTFSSRRPGDYLTKDHYETIPPAVPPTPLKTHNPVVEKQRPATVAAATGARDRNSTHQPTTTTQKGFATGFGAAINKILHKHKTPTKDPKYADQGKELRFDGAPTHTAARAVARSNK